ncbi:MAG: ABC transporter substrate-binding protein [Parvibaculaceae bacterium]
MKVVAGVLALLIGGICPGQLETRAQAQDATGITLRVGQYGGSFAAAQRKYTADLFTKRTGIQVEFIEANPGDHLAKMIASRGREPPYDIVYLDDDVQVNAIKAGVLDKIDESLVPNMKNVYDEARNKLGYGPGIIFVGVGIAYSRKKFEEAGLPPPSSWNDLWNPKLAGHLAIPDLSSVSGRNFLVAAALLNGGNEETLERGIEKISSLQVHSFYSASAQAEALLTSGDAWAAVMVSGRAWGMIDRGLPFGFVFPKEKGGGGLTTVDVVKGTKYAKEALAYIDFTLDPLPQLGQAYEIPYGPTNRLLGPVIAAYPEMARKFPASPEQLAQQIRVPDWEAYYKHHQKAVDLWNRQVLRQ